MIFGDARDGNIAGLLNSVRSKGFFPLIGGGRAMMQPIFVEDLVEAIVSAWQRPETIGRSYDLAGPEPISLRRVLEILREEAEAKTVFVPLPRALALLAAWPLDYLRGRRETGLAAQVRRLGEDKTFEIAAARRDLDFAPRSFAAAVRRKIEWLNEAK